VIKTGNVLRFEVPPILFARGRVIEESLQPVHLCAAQHEAALGTFEKCRRLPGMSAYRGIVLKKSFWGDERNFWSC
jgi:hypothetical protein